LREQQDPAVRLGAATARHLEALHVAADISPGQRWLPTSTKAPTVCSEG